LGSSCTYNGSIHALRKAANGVVTTPLQVRREALGTPAQPLPLTANGRVRAETRPALACKKIRAISRDKFKEFKINHMTSKFVRLLMFTVFAASVAAMAQSAALPAAPSAAASNADAPAAAISATGTRTGTVNVEQAIFATNEGQRDFEALSKKLEPKQTELKGQNDEVESLKKQLNTQGEKLNDESRATLVKQIEQKQKSLERSVQDARDDAQNQQNEIAQRILQKLGPMLVKYAAENGFGVIIDTSQPWPNGPVLWSGPAVDITRPIVELYNAQSGVPAPAARPAGAKPVGSTTRPATTAPAKPATTAPKAPATQPK
jgi:outer membrane protein